MGRSYTCNYQAQVDTGEHLVLMGAMRYQEAIDKVVNEARRIGSKLGYIWPQSSRAKGKIKCDYLQIDLIEENKYTLTQHMIGE